MKLRGAIFDLDGTLLDSMSIWDTVGEDYLRSLGMEPKENLAETFQKMSLSQAADYYRTVYGVQKSGQEIIDGINSMIESFYMEKAPLKAGVREALELLNSARVKMCIATATDRYLVDGALKRCRVRQYFSELFTCGETGFGKDRPDIYETALAYLGTKKEETAVFEDALHAAKTAKAAGFPVIGVYDRSEKNQKELHALADTYLDSFNNFKL